MSAHAEVIVNGRAGPGHGADVAEKLGALLAAAGITARVAVAHAPDDLAQAAQRAVRGRPRCVVAAGGDGTINAVAAQLAGSDVALGVLPLGTLNHFARDLRIPLDLPQAAATIAAGHAMRVDVGEVNQRIFLNNSSIGLYPQIVRDRQRRQRHGRSKWVAFAAAALEALLLFRFVRVRLTVDGGSSFQRRAPFVFVGNNRYELEGFTVGKRAALDGGELSLYTAQHRTRLGLMLLALRALFGRLHQEKDFEALAAREILVESRHGHLHVATDGEVALLTTPLRYRILPGALRVIVPAPA